jgi:hypothetical protein
VDVEEAGRSDRAESVGNAGRSRHVRPRAGPHRFPPEQELDLAVEDEERVDVVVVVVGVDTFPALVERHLQQRELGRLGPNRVLDDSAHQPLAAVRPRHNRLSRPVGLVDVVAVPGEVATGYSSTQVLDEASVGRMDVQVASSAGTGNREPVDDPGRDGNGRPWTRLQRLGAICDFEFALENVEHVDVLLVEVRPGTLEGPFHVDLVDRQLGPLDLHDDPLVQPLALAGA